MAPLYLPAIGIFANAQALVLGQKFFSTRNLEGLLAIAAFTGFFLIMHYLSKISYKLISNRQRAFMDFQFSSLEFYDEVKKAVTKRNIPSVAFDTVEHAQGSMFSESRTYLQIMNNRYIFEICAAPYASGSFVSWWLRERGPNLMSRVPIINTLLGINPKYKTLYQHDTEAMYRMFVQQCVQDAIEAISSAKGVRIPLEVGSDVVQTSTDT